MAEAACANLSGRLETEVTSRFISCSMLSFFNAAADALESGCWANPGSATPTRPNVRSIDVAAATVLGSAIGRYPLVYRASCYDCAPGRAPWLALAVARDGPFPHKLPFSPGAVVIRVTRTDGGSWPWGKDRATRCRSAGEVLGRFCGTDGRFATRSKLRP